MKNFPFCHSVPSCHPFRKWMALGLFAFIAGLAGTRPMPRPPGQTKTALRRRLPKKGVSEKKDRPEQHGLPP